jgi:hypothetical protein
VSEERLTCEADVRDALGTLARYTNRPFTDEAVTVFCRAFARKLTHRQFGEAMATWLQSHGPSSYLPSVKDIEGIVSELRRDRWMREKADSPTFAQAAARQSDPYVAAGLRMLARYCDPQVTWRDRAKLARDFAREHGVLEPWTRMAEECDAAARGDAA